jgi:hypothetical protein
MRACFRLAALARPSVSRRHALGKKASSVSSEEVRVEILFCDEAAGLAVNGMQRSRSQLRMQWNGHGLPFARWQGSPHLAVTPSRRNDLESELNEGGRNVAP